MSTEPRRPETLQTGSEPTQNAAPSYTIEHRENGRRLSIEPMPDPFVNTTIHPRGWRAAWAILRRRYSVEVIVSADRETAERVLELNPDYTGAPGSERNREWKAELEGALHDFAAREAEFDV